MPARPNSTPVPGQRSFLFVRHPRAEAGALAIAALLCLSFVTPVSAQENEPERPGLLSGIRQRLAGRSPGDTWREARAKAKAAEALPLMQDLLAHGGDSPYPALAGLWLGHFYYGTGQIEAANGYFEQARQKGREAAVQDEACFWVAQCRNLLGQELVGSEPHNPRSVGAVMAGIAGHDGQLRTGEVGAALQGYLGLEGEARRAGCLGPLLYRVGLMAATMAGRGNRPAVDWDLVRRWEPAAATSPERALISAMTPRPSGANSGPGSAEENGEPSASGGPTGPDSSSVTGIDPPNESSAGTTQSAEAPYYVVQFGAFTDHERAMNEMEHLITLGLSVRLDHERTDGVMYFKLRTGHAASKEEAEDLGRRLGRDVSWQVVRVAL
jgi:hypothetical protein